MYVTIKGNGLLVMLRAGGGEGGCDICVYLLFRIAEK